MPRLLFVYTSGGLGGCCSPSNLVSQVFCMWLILSAGFLMVIAQKGHSCLFFERVSGLSVWVFRLLMVKAALNFGGHWLTGLGLDIL